MAIQFNVYWSFIQGTGVAGTKIENVTSPYDHTGLDGGWTYWYVVTAYDTDTSLESDASNELSGTPLNLPNAFGNIIS
jgi:hypothetical protein